MNDQSKRRGRALQKTIVESIGYSMLTALIKCLPSEEELRAITERLDLSLRRAMPSLLALAQIDWVDAKRRLDELPTKSKNAMRSALNEGWFFGWHDGLQSLMELVERLANTPSTDVDDIMRVYYRRNLKAFADQLTKEYPNRAGAIDAAVNAHTSNPNDGYFLSIPVFVAQADGLLAEVLGVESAITKAAETLRKKYEDDPGLLDLLYPFLELKTSSFMMSARARENVAKTSGKRFTALNRHQVMHGERSDYATEMNSLKRFSFLVFVGLHIPAVLARDAPAQSEDP